MQGILLVDKPAGWTSFDVVNYVRKIVAAAENRRPKQVKVGHAGTLDPFATGLLVLLIGKEYTRRAAEFSKLDKTYEAGLELGKISTTGDPEGAIAAFDSRVPNLTELQTAVKKLTGSIQQTPPAYSAIKVDGQRAYKLARAGQTVELKPRQVTINRLEITDYQYPLVKLTAEVSSGTYIRSLVADLGQALGTGAYTTSLRRTLIGQFNIDKALDVNLLNTEILETVLNDYI